MKLLMEEEEEEGFDFIGFDCQQLVAMIEQLNIGNNNYCNNYGHCNNNNNCCNSNYV